MNKLKLYEAYKSHRTDFMPAKIALYLGKKTKTSNPYPITLEEGARFHEKGFSIAINVTADDGVDTYGIGEFSDRPEQDAIPHRPGNEITYKYFIPTTKIAEHRSWYQKHGYSKHDSYTRARQYVLEDYKLMIQICEYGQAFITVTASKNGICLGSDTLGRCDWNCIEEAIIEYDMVKKAINNAQINLQALCNFSEEKL